jgi:hypothetical protein
MTTNARVVDYKGIETQVSDTKVALEFFKGLFNRIKQGFGASLSSKFNSKKILNTAYVFIDNNVDRVARNSLSRSLENFIFGKYYSANKQYFVVTQIYRSKEVGLLFVTGDEKGIQASLEVAELARLYAGKSKLEKGEMVTFYKNRKVAIPFAIELHELSYGEGIDVKTVQEGYDPKSPESPKKVAKKAKKMKVMRTKYRSSPILRELKKRKRK